MNGLRNRITKNIIYKWFAIYVQRVLTFVNPKIEIYRNYKAHFNHLPNLDEPHDLIEKIYWMQLHCDTSTWTLYADKYRMRSYCEELGLDEFLPKVYGVWESVNDIKWDELPQRFVMKLNNGCGTVWLVDNKDKYDINGLKRKIQKFIKMPYGYRGYQPHYLGIKPLIFAEEYLEASEDQKSFSPVSMVDYKVWCFNGHVESCFVAYNRSKTGLTVDLYDVEWNRLTEHLQNFHKDRFDPNVSVPKPKSWDMIKQIASKLSVGQPQMRVDFYEVGGKPYIGELTMASGFGYFKESYYRHLGDLTDVNLLPRKK